MVAGSSDMAREILLRKGDGTIPVAQAWFNRACWHRRIQEIAGILQ
jgi:hypothetical protein